MAKVEVKSLEGATLRELELADEVFKVAPNQSLMWEAVQSYLASRRRGTHKTRSRGEVSGGGKKPWRQKGTGRARAGSIRSSLWRHGSIAHGPVPRDYGYELPKKMLRMARSVLVVNHTTHRNLELSAQNIPGCALVRHHAVHPYDILSHEGLLISEGAIVRLQEALR